MRTQCLVLEVSFQSELIPSRHFVAIIIATKLLKHELRKQCKSVYRLSGHIRDYRNSPHKNSTENHNVFKIYNKPTRCNSGSIVFIKNYKYALHV